MESTAAALDMPEDDFLLLAQRQVRGDQTTTLSPEQEDPRMDHTQAVFSPLNTIECHPRFVQPFVGIKSIPQGEVVTVKKHFFETRHSDKSRTGVGQPNVPVVEQTPPFIVAEKLMGFFGVNNRLVRTRASGFVWLQGLTGYGPTVHDAIQALALPRADMRSGRAALLKMRDALKRRVSADGKTALSLEELGTKGREDFAAVEGSIAEGRRAAYRARYESVIAKAIDTIRRTPVNEYTGQTCEQATREAIVQMYDACEAAVLFAIGICRECRANLEAYVSTGKGFGQPDEFEMICFEQLDKQPPELARNTSDSPVIGQLGGAVAATAPVDNRPKKNCFACRSAMFSEAGFCSTCHVWQPGFDPATGLFVGTEPRKRAPRKAAEQPPTPSTEEELPQGQASETEATTPDVPPADPETGLVPEPAVVDLAATSIDDDLAALISPGSTERKVREDA